jgi:hypothetical protein
LEKVSKLKVDLWDESIKMVADMMAAKNLELVTHLMGEKVIHCICPTNSWRKIKNRDK